MKIKLINASGVLVAEIEVTEDWGCVQYKGVVYLHLSGNNGEYHEINVHNIDDSLYR